MCSPSVSVVSINGIQNAACFSGSDIGQQVNNAIAALPKQNGNYAGTVYIPAGSYTQTTTVVVPRGVMIQGASGGGTIINYTGTGWAFVISGSDVYTYFPQGGMTDVCLSGPGNTSTSGAIYFGGSVGLSSGSGTVNTSGTSVTSASGTGFDTNWTNGRPICINGTTYLIASVANSTSLTLRTSAGSQSGVAYYVTGDPVTSISPSANNGAGVVLNRVRIISEPTGPSFGIGVQFGNNAWSVTISQCSIGGCNAAVYFPSGVANSGENIVLNACCINDNQGLGVNLGGLGIGLDFHLYACSIDYNGGVAIQNGVPAGGDNNIALFGCHIEQTGVCINNYGSLELYGCTFVGNSATYLISQQGTSFLAEGCVFENSAAGGTVMNSSGYAGIFISNVLVAGVSLGVVPAGFDTAGNLFLNGKCTNYAGTPTVAGGIPAVVGEISLTGQTANVPSTNLVSSPAVGWYRVSAYVVLTTRATTGSTLPSAVLAWTDNDSNTIESVSLTTTSGANTKGQVETANIVVYDGNPANAIQIHTTGYASSPANTMEYSLRVIAEYLGA